MTAIDSNTVVITEVGPRDGIQNHPHAWTVAERIALVQALLGCVVPSKPDLNVEFGAFVNPKRVPNMEHSDAVFKDIVAKHYLDSRASHISNQLIALVPNMRGFDDAQRTGVKHIAIFASASEAFSQANIGMSIKQAIANYTTVVAAAKGAGCRIRAYISCGWWCPYDGKVDASAVLNLTRVFTDLACDQIVLADTIGKASPTEVAGLLKQIISQHRSTRHIGLHFHDTDGLALQNVDVALDAGYRYFDAAIAGLGGCPFAPGAPGNLNTFSLAAHLDKLGYATNVDLVKLDQVTRHYSSLVKQFK